MSLKFILTNQLAITDKNPLNAVTNVVGTVFDDPNVIEIEDDADFSLYDSRSAIVNIATPITFTPPFSVINFIVLETDQEIDISITDASGAKIIEGIEKIFLTYGTFSSLAITATVDTTYVKVLFVGH